MIRPQFIYRQRPALRPVLQALFFVKCPPILRAILTEPMLVKLSTEPTLTSFETEPILLGIAIEPGLTATATEPVLKVECC